MRRLFFLLLLLSVSAFACAAGGPVQESGGKSKGGGFARFDNAIKRFLMSGLDTTYIAVSPTSFEVPVVSNLYGITTVVPLKSGKLLQMESGNGIEAGIGIGYHGLDYVQTFTIREKNKANSYFSFDFYDNYWGLNFTVADNQHDDLGIGSSSFTFNAYYAVYGNKYSYPASFYGNFIQKKSAGSPIITCWYNHLTLWNLKDRDTLPGPTNIDNVTICGGYGYNWVFGKGKTVLNLSGDFGMMIPYWGIAAQARCGVMHWVNDWFRLNFSAIGFFCQGKKDVNYSLLNTEWRVTVGATVCFGKF